MINKAQLLGNVGNEPKIIEMNNGKKCATFSLATSESWTDKQTGERKNKTEWHKVVIFNEGTVKYAEKAVNKGDKLYIEGKITTRKYTGNDGVEKYTTEIVLQGYNSQLMKLDKSNSNNLESLDGNTSHDNSSNDYNNDISIEDDIPF